LSYVVAPSIAISGVQLSTALTHGFSSGSTGNCNVELIVGILLPKSGSCTIVISSSQSWYHCTILHVLNASPSPLGVINEDNWLVAQSISGWPVLHRCNPST
jgi:hypothetical protein